MTFPRRGRYAFAVALLLSSAACGGGGESSATDGNPAVSATPDGAASPGDRDASGRDDPDAARGDAGPDGAGDGGSEQQPVSKVATVRVHYPVGTRSLVLKGDQPPLTASGTPLADLSNDTWELSLGDLDAPVSFTPALDGKSARGPAYSISPGQTLDVYPHFDATAGQITMLPKFHSGILNNDRGLRIYLPPSYEENSSARYPVVYMHDGQVVFAGNLDTFDGAAKGFFGSWNAEKTIDQGIERGTLPEMIVVGVDIIIKFDAKPADFLKNLTEIREQELTPTRDDANPLGRQGTGKGSEYLRMIVEEIKPKIDAEYRTLADREHTFMAGSSLGGLMSIWAGIDHGDVFGGVIAMSSSAWWDDEIAAKRVEDEDGGPKRTSKVYTDIGDDESGQSSAEADAADVKFLEQTERLWEAYRSVGYMDDVTLKTLVDPGGQHKGDYWSERFPAALQFIVGKGR